MKFNEDVLRGHPDWSGALKIIETLQKQGYEAVFAGGCVRDGFLGRKPKDLDIATSADPNQVENLFSQTVAVGKAFGVIRVLDFTGDLEVASFRFDGLYEDGRRPQSVAWATAPEDAKRRDFTINALFYEPSAKKILDYVDGIADIEKKVIRCVGEPALRFQEDHLRLLRAVRFAAELKFSLEGATWKAIQAHAHLVSRVSPERIRDEILRLMRAADAKGGFALLHESGLMKAIDLDLFQEWSSDKSWPEPSANEFVAWTYYFYWTAFAKLKDRLAKYKLSREVQKFVGTALKYVTDSEAIAQAWSLGRQLAEAKNAEFKLAMQMLAGQDWVLELQKELASRNLLENYPQALLNGHDIPASILPAERGKWMDLAYQKQLELNLQEKAELLKLLSAGEKKS